MAKNPAAQRARKKQRQLEAQDRQLAYTAKPFEEKLRNAGKRERQKLLSRQAEAV